jgi:hypothetical protein
MREREERPKGVAPESEPLAGESVSGEDPPESGNALQHGDEELAQAAGVKVDQHETKGAAKIGESPAVKKASKKSSAKKSAKKGAK